MLSRDKSLVQAVELWFPQGEVMAFGAGAARGDEPRSAASESLRFHYGEGLPGAVWASARALLWKDPSAAFARAEPATAQGADAAVGWPLFDGDRLIAIVTFLLSHRAEVASCLEAWDVDEELDVLKHAHGYYVHCGDFERMSPLIHFGRGSGLPGLTWRSGGVEVMADVRKSSSFIRAGLAASCGLKHGVGIPVYAGRKLVQVLALIGADQQSFIGGAELYRPQARELGAATLFDWSGPSSPGSQSSADAPGREQAQGVLHSRLPSVSKTRLSSGKPISLALPIHDRKGLKEILVLRF